MTSPVFTRVPSVTFNCVMREVIFGERSAFRSASTYPVAERSVVACPSVTTDAVTVSTLFPPNVRPAAKKAATPAATTRTAARSSHPRRPRAFSGSRRMRSAERSAGVRSLSWLMGRELSILFRLPGGLRRPRGRSLQRFGRTPACAARPADAAGRFRPVATATAGVIIPIVLWNNALLAAVISIHAATPGTIYRIELAGNQTVWSEDLPRDSGALVLFHRYPGGMLVSVKRADVRRVAAAPRVAEAPKRLQTGGDIMIGTLGGPDGIGIRRGEGSPRGDSCCLPEESRCVPESARMEPPS